MNHLKVKFETAASKHGQRRIRSPKPSKPTPPPRVPHVAKLMALAIRLEHLIETRVVKILSRALDAANSGRTSVWPRYISAEPTCILTSAMFP